jgi:hypothetical protein
MLPYKGPGKCQYEELMVGAYELFNVTASVHPTCAELFKGRRADMSAYLVGICMWH